MVKVIVKFFASLKEELGIDCITIDVESNATVADVWCAATQKTFPEHVLCAVNHQYTSNKATIKTGDEIAFFPPVSGG